MKKEQIAGQIFSVILFFILMYFWVEDKNLSQTIYAISIYLIVLVFSDLIIIYKDKNK